MDLPHDLSLVLWNTLAAIRVIQTHFAASNNVGAVAAKEEVWEVFGQLTGYAASLALLKGLQFTGVSSITGQKRLASSRVYTWVYVRKYG